jgi:hypothetical protein
MSEKAGDVIGIGSDDDLVRACCMFEDSTCQNYLSLAMQQYIEALKLDSKHVYQALPRLLSLWFDLSSIDCESIKKVLHGRLLMSSSKDRSGCSRVQVSSDLTGKRFWHVIFPWLFGAWLLLTFQPSFVRRFSSWQASGNEQPHVS